jgi:hypothetical protein
LYYLLACIFGDIKWTSTKKETHILIDEYKMYYENNNVEQTGKKNKWFLQHQICIQQKTKGQSLEVTSFNTNPPA